MPSAAVLTAVLLLAAACALEPLRPVLPYPDHIHAGLARGDTVEVTMTDGSRHKLIVDTIDQSALHGDGLTLAFEDIAAISKRSFEPVANPCDDGTPVGCSVPTAITLASEFHARYASRFDDACIAHDYCYRHGHRTYGNGRRDCDRRFAEAMRESCAATLELDPVARAECLLAASEFHLAVRRAGKSRFLTDSSTYCEYRGPVD